MTEVLLMPRTGAVERTIATLELLAVAEEPMRLSAIAQQLGMPKSAAHRTLKSLMEAGWVEQSLGNDCYSLTLQIALLGQRLLTSRGVADLRQPILDDLAKKTRELVRLTAVQNGTLVWSGSARGRRMGLVYEPDMNEKIIPFATANGKVWLADMPRERALKIALDGGLGVAGPGGPGRITTLRDLEIELDKTAARGYGLALEEAEVGVGAVAVSIRIGERLVGTMSVAAPLARLQTARIDHILPLLRRAATSMSLAWNGKRTAQSP